MPWCRRRPSGYVWEHVRFATQPLESPDDPAQLLAAIEFLRPADTLLYASDFPHWDFDEPEQTLRLPLRDAPAQGEVRLLELCGHRVGLYRVGAELHALADRCRPGAASSTSGRAHGRTPSASTATRSWSRSTGRGAS